MKQNNPMTNVEYRKKCSQPGKLNGMYGKTHLVGDLNPTKRPEVREKISKSMAKAIANGGGYTRNTIRGYYKDEHYDSSWELLYMKYLEKNNINWTKKHKIIIPYIWENITHNYVPDFLINDNEIHEVKPLFRLKDKQTFEKIRAGEKWCNQHGYIFKLIADSTIEKLKSAEVI